MQSLRRLAVVLSIVAVSCGGGRHSGPTDSALPIPTSPSTVVVGSITRRSSSVFVPEAVAFPPRNEALAFRQQLEAKYRDQLDRASSATFVDLEGDIVWTQEYLRYRVNGCDHATAVQKVFSEIRGGGIPAVCSEAPSNSVAFPPRNEPFDFRQQLEALYRDLLGRSPSATFVDLEGDIVWTQEYFRYRVTGFSHPDAQDATLTQVDGNPPPPIPTPKAGTWSYTLSVGVPLNGVPIKRCVVLSSGTTVVSSSGAFSIPFSVACERCAESGTVAGTISVTGVSGSVTDSISGPISGPGGCTNQQQTPAALTGSCAVGGGIIQNCQGGSAPDDLSFTLTPR